MVTYEQALAYLGIDEVDEVVETNVKRALKTAEKTLEGAVGKDLQTYLPDDPRAEELTLIYTDDLYSERGVAAKVSNATRKLVFSMEWQLKLELRQAKEEAGVL